VGWDKSQALVEAERIDPRAVARELDEPAAEGPGSLDRRSHEVLTDAVPTMLRAHTHALELAARQPRSTHSPDDGELKAANNLTFHFRNQILVAGVLHHRIECVPVYLRQRLTNCPDDLAGCAESVVGEEADDGGYVGAFGASHANIAGNFIGNVIEPRDRIAGLTGLDGGAARCVTSPTYRA